MNRHPIRRASTGRGSLPVRRPLHFPILLLFLLVFTPGLYGETFVYNQISQEEGLLSVVQSIYKGDNREVWIGTQSGLYRFDGVELQHYEHDERPCSLPGNSVYQITRDARGNFWILTDGGAALYDGTQDTFRTLSSESGENPALFSYCTDDRGLYFGATNRIYRYDYGASSLREFVTFASSEPYVVQHLCLLSDGRLLCSNNLSGLRVLDPVSREFGEVPFAAPREVSGLHVDTRGRVWVAGYNRGVQCFSADGRELARYDSHNSALSNDVVLCFAEHNGRIWMGTDGGGINILDPESGDLTIVSHVPGDHASLPANSIRCLYGNSQEMWAGSVRDGVINIRRSSMRTYTDVPEGNRHGLSNPTVLHLYREPGSTHIWIGTDGEGLNSLDTRSGLFTHYPTTRGCKVASIAGYSEDQLLLSLFSRGFYLFDKRSGALRRIELGPGELEEQMCRRGRTVNLTNESDGNLLLLSTRLYRYDLRTRRCTELVVDDGRPLAGNLYAAGPSPEGCYLHDNRNLYEVVTGGGMRRVKGFTDRRIHSAFSDEGDRLWLATDQGLSSYTPSTGRLENYSTTLFKEATSVIRDHAGRVWIGSGNRLFAYLPGTGRFAMFGASDGVQPNEYLEKPRLLTPCGTYMGGVNGLLYIDGEFEIDTSERPVIQFVDLELDGHALREGHGARLRIPYNSKTAVLRIAAVEKDLFRRKIYRYLISGQEEQSFESYSPVLTLRPLPAPGRHDIFVSCSMRDGSWTESVRVLTLDIQPPWYRTWWFIAGAFCLAVLGVAFFFMLLLRRRKNRMLLLMKEHEQQIYEEKVRFLINVSHELRTPLTLIHAPLKRLLDKMQPGDRGYASLTRIYRQAGHMKEMLNTVLDLRRMEVGVDRLQIGSYDINGWMKQLVADFTDEAQAQGVRLECIPDPALGNVHFDRRKCTIILNNLLMNALKHSTSGSSIRVESSKCDGRVRISVIDQGPGLHGVDMQQLFTRFYQGRDEQSGTGIGLSYAKILVEQQGGTIDAFNNEERGATFRFEIPDDLPLGDTAYESKAYLNEFSGRGENGEQEGAGTDPVSEPSFDTRNTKLLFVDDSREFTGFISEALGERYAEIRCAGDGEEALHLLAEYQPDIIVSDIMMPRMDGYALCRHLKHDVRFSHIPIILLTARSEELSQQQGYKLGADAFLGKPFELDTLQELIGNLLKSRMEIKQRYAGIYFPDPQDAAFSSADEQFLLRLNRIITDHISDPTLDIPFISREIGMSRASLYNKLKALTDMGASDYILKLRMGKALSLIEQTELTFAEIADRTGFSTARYFSTVFKQYTGETPTRYRERRLREREDPTHAEHPREKEDNGRGQMPVPPSSASGERPDTPSSGDTTDAPFSAASEAESLDPSA